MMKLGRPNLDEFADTLLMLARQDRDVLVLTGDSRGSGRLVPFSQALPEQIIEIGIAEQTLIGVAAGLASAGKKVFAVLPACFLTARALEQIKNDVAYSDNPVKVVGISAGVSYGALGTTHHSLHDYAALRAIHNITILAPADNFETRRAVQLTVDYPHPVYLRFGKAPQYDLHTSHPPFAVGKAITLKRGSDVCFIATGETVYPAYAASEILEGEGVSCEVISMHTIKPLDNEAVLDAAHKARVMITVEEHSVYGGLGEAGAAVLMQNRVSLPFQIVGIPDEDTVTGSQAEVFAHYGISAIGLAATARRLLEIVKA